jgi:lipid II:glycine glycyltransferase (peptidoglycan interpeptide bridge formation enzyme)
MKSLLQTQEWASLKEQQGWSVHWVDEILVLEKPLPLGLSFLYVPEVDFFKINFQTFLPKIKEIIKKSHSIFTRLDFINQKNSFFGKKIEKILCAQKMIKAFEEIQPEFRQIIDISKSEEKILAQMKPKGRYNIKVAEKYGLTIERLQTTDYGLQQKSIDIFYDIFKETARRDGFEIRPKKYFEDLMRILQKDGLAELLVIRYNQVPVAAGIFTFYEEMASYMYGASLSEYRQVMAPYLMHWEAIKIAKAKGCKFYDLLAISPFDSSYQLPATSYKHKYAGITRFKEQFGGMKYQTVGGWDMVYNKSLYNVFKFLEKIRRK